MSEMKTYLLTSLQLLRWYCLRVSVTNLSWLVEENEVEARLLYTDARNWSTGFLPVCTSLKVNTSLALFRLA